MKILYVNFSYDTWGHIHLDEAYIRMLSSFAEVYVIARKGWYTDLPESVRLIPYDPPFRAKKPPGKYEQYKMSVLVMKFAGHVQRQMKFDYTVAGTFNTLTLALTKKWFTGCNMYIMHHNNTDLLSRPLYKKIFERYMLCFSHIVQEDFIKEYLVTSIGIPRAQVVHLPHPLNPCNTGSGADKYYDCVGISNSNDEAAVDRLVRLEKETHIFRDKKLRILLRSSGKEYKDEYVQVIKGYLPSRTYQEYINQAKSILIPFPDTFQYRESGSVIDALSNHIPVIGRKNRLLEAYSRLYPGICMQYEHVESLPDMLEKLNETDPSLRDRSFSRFMEEHSDERILKILQDIFL